MAQEPQKGKTIENILQLTDNLFRELLPMLPKEWLHLDLTMAQLKVVLLLFISGPSRMSDIASELGVSLATATGVMDRLVERRILLRNGDPEDRRVVLCRLSNEGENLIHGLWHLTQKRAGELMRAIEPPQLLLITEALQALLHITEATRDSLQQGEA